MGYSHILHKSYHDEFKRWCVQRGFPVNAASADKYRVLQRKGIR